METAVLTAIVEQVKILPNEMQYQVLSFARTLRAFVKQGTPGKKLLKFAKRIPKDDVEDIRRAIQAGCEQVDLNEW